MRLLGSSIKSLTKSWKKASAEDPSAGNAVGIDFETMDCDSNRRAADNPSGSTHSGEVLRDETADAGDGHGPKPGDTDKDASNKSRNGDASSAVWEAPDDMDEEEDGDEWRGDRGLWLRCKTDPATVVTIAGEGEDEAEAEEDAAG